ncbi:unnamed protein product, partial [Musa hybrid cultivar]
MVHPPPPPPPPYPLPERLKEVKQLSGQVTRFLWQGPFSEQTTEGRTTPPRAYPPEGPPKPPPHPPPIPAGTWNRLPWPKNLPGSAPNQGMPAPSSSSPWPLPLGSSASRSSAVARTRTRTRRRLVFSILSSLCSVLVLLLLQLGIPGGEWSPQSCKASRDVVEGERRVKE